MLYSWREIRAKMARPRNLGGRLVRLQLAGTIVLGFSLAAAGNVVAGDVPPISHHYFSKTPADHAATWAYTGTFGPKSWAALDTTFQLCGNGKMQSPVAITSNAPIGVSLPRLKFDYRPEQIRAVNNGHSIEHVGRAGSSLALSGQIFALEQFHVHVPSEHTLDGKQFPGELHFVHKSAKGDVVVVAVFIQSDEKSSIDVPLYNDIPRKTGETVSFEGTRNPTDYLPKTYDYFSYTGSFTTPPCNESVTWIVMKQPIGVQPKIISQFAAVLKNNNRPLQDLSNRIVQRSNAL